MVIDWALAALMVFAFGLWVFTLARDVREWRRNR